MKRILVILFILFLQGALGQNDALFSRATAAYNEGDYNKAIENYLSILENGQHSAELYFNLGNAHYKLNQVAPSIYYYEKALLLSPNDEEVKNNLAFAQNMTLDAIEDLPKTGLSDWYNGIINFGTFDQWAYAAVAFTLLFVLLYIAFYYLRYATQKRIAFISSIAALFIAIITLVFAFISYRTYMQDNPAIVFVEEVIVKTEPNERSQEVFRLHAGTKLNVIEELDIWKKVRIADGQTGWLTNENIKLLKDF